MNQLMQWCMGNFRRKSHIFMNRMARTQWGNPPSRAVGVPTPLSERGVLAVPDQNVKPETPAHPCHARRGYPPLLLHVRQLQFFLSLRLMGYFSCGRPELAKGGSTPSRTHKGAHPSLSTRGGPLRRIRHRKRGGVTPLLTGNVPATVPYRHRKDTGNDKSKDKACKEPPRVTGNGDDDTGNERPGRMADNHDGREGSHPDVDQSQRTLKNCKK